MMTLKAEIIDIWYSVDIGSFSCSIAHRTLLFSEEKEEGSSSDWSSSDKDDDNDSAAINPLRPSTHSALQAQWEWRAIEESLSNKWVKLTNNLQMFSFCMNF